MTSPNFRSTATTAAHSTATPALTRRSFLTLSAFGLAGLGLTGLAGCGSQSASGTDQKGGSVSITNVSYDPTRELYEQYNKLFAKHWKQEADQDFKATQSHGGSGKQALAVAQGLEADVVTLALEADVNEIVKAGLIDKDWVKRFPKDSSPYTSTIVFLVRKGNPKNIKDWGDVIKDGVGVITPNPKTSGGARWNYLAAWAWAKKEYDADEKKIKDYIKKLYANVLVLDSGARGATTSFVENGQGDVLLAWENEAYLSKQEHPDDYEIVTPSISILCQPSVAVVDDVVKRRGTEKVAKEYLNYLYSDEAQRLAGKNFYRPSTPKILEEFKDTFQDTELATIKDFGGWTKAQKEHFSDGGVFDQVYEK